MSFLNIIKLIIILFIFNSCVEKSKVKSNPYFNFGDVLIEQKIVLDKSNPTVLKSINYNGLKEIIKDTIDWDLELKMFWNYDLSKSIYQGEFKIDTLHIDSQLFFNYYPKKENEKIRKYFLTTDSIGRIQHLEIEVKDQNIFYSTYKHIDLEFGLYSNVFPILKSYEVISKRKIIFNDEECLLLNSKILI